VKKKTVFPLRKRRKGASKRGGGLLYLAVASIVLPPEKKELGGSSCARLAGGKGAFPLFYMMVGGREEKRDVKTAIISSGGGRRSRSISSQGKGKVRKGGIPKKPSTTVGRGRESLLYRPRLKVIPPSFRGKEKLRKRPLFTAGEKTGERVFYRGKRKEKTLAKKGKKGLWPIRPRKEADSLLFSERRGRKRRGKKPLKDAFSLRLAVREGRDARSYHFPQMGSGKRGAEKKKDGIHPFNLRKAG